MQNGPSEEKSVPAAPNSTPNSTPERAEELNGIMDGLRHSEAIVTAFDHFSSSKPADSAPAPKSKEAESCFRAMWEAKDGEADFSPNSKKKHI